MIKPHRPVARLLWSASLLAVAGVATGRLATAQEVEEAVVEEAPAAARGFVVAFEYPDEMFDQWVYGNTTNAPSGRARLESALTLQIDALDRSCGLTDVQKKKLQLAGRGDIKRFLDKVEESRKKFQAVKKDQNKIGQVFQDIQPLQAAFRAGLFGEGSIFAKAVNRTLDEGQAARYEKVLRDKRQYRYRAKVDLAIAMMDNAVVLSADQRRRFSDAIMEGTRPPLRFGQQDYYVVLYQASKLPEAEVKPIFDDNQWRVLSQQLAQARAMAPMLMNNGFVPVADEAGGRIKAAVETNEVRKPLETKDDVRAGNPQP